MNELFGYEKLQVYQCAVEFLAVSHLIIDKLPKGYAHLGDQLRRASLSIPLNIAEGSAQPTRSERMRYFGIARASALESSAVVNGCLLLKLVDPALLSNARTLVYRIVQMLSKLAPRTR
jgi:four helix bundle protein